MRYKLQFSVWPRSVQSFRFKAVLGLSLAESGRINCGSPTLPLDHN
jgi:hypothetical protein